jgi:hypothetical protein
METTIASASARDSFLPKDGTCSAQLPPKADARNDGSYYRSIIFFVCFCVGQSGGVGDCFVLRPRNDGHSANTVRLYDR